MFPPRTSPAMTICSTEEMFVEVIRLSSVCTRHLICEWKYAPLYNIRERLHKSDYTREIPLTSCPGDNNFTRQEVEEGLIQQNKPKSNGSLVGKGLNLGQH